jgi:hypothetical protein
MKAARIHRFGPPSVIAIEEVPRPVPGSGEVLVRGFSWFTTVLTTKLFTRRDGFCLTRMILPVVLARSEKPIFVVKKGVGENGTSAELVFVSGMVRDGNR